MATTSTTELSRALASLSRALSEPKTDITCDAAIQRFEFCVELSWRTARRLMGTSATAPRVVVREMAAQGLISDPVEWLVFLDARNESSHTYREEVAEKVLAVAVRFLPQGQALLTLLDRL